MINKLLSSLALQTTYKLCLTNDKPDRIVIAKYASLFFSTGSDEEKNKTLKPDD
jgi:hypothetical protein